MSSITEKISKSTEELSKLSSLFQRSSIKEGIYSDLKEIEQELIKMPILESNIASLNIDFNQHKETSKKDLEDLNLNLRDLNIKHLLVSRLLAAKSTNKGLFEYKSILYGDFMTFANTEESLANEAEAILKLQAIEQELEVITAYPKLYKKNTVAIGGGFSSGKSEFISSFFKDGLKLPIGIEPTTAIPAYVINSEHQHVVGCSQRGGAVDLKEIDSELYSRLSHKFIKSFAFNLKEIMPFMVYATNINYEHICFIDTPGYNPSDVDDGYTNEDITTAKEFLDNAATFIWLIGADANGTIPASDLDFLDELDLENKRLYVVLNKADLRGASDIEDILDEIEASLDDYDIEVVGISAYSSISKEEYSYRKQPILEFIDDCDIEAKIHKDIIERLYEVYAMYKYAILKNIKEKKTIQTQLKSISLDLLEEGFDNMGSPIYQRLDKLGKAFDIKKQQKNLKLLEKAIKDLKSTIDMVFEKELEIDMQDIKDDDVKIDFDFDIDNMSIDDEIEKFEKAKPKVKRPKKKIEVDEEEVTILNNNSWFNPFLKNF